MGVTNHVCVSLQGFEEMKDLRDKSLSLRTENKKNVAAKLVGDIHIYFDNFRKTILIYDFYLPCFKRNLIFVAFLYKDGLTMTFNN